MNAQLQDLVRRRISQAKTVESVVVEALREAILKGMLQSGQWLRQDELAAAFGVSRMPVREALRQLESEGLVKVFPYRGAVVSSLSREEVVEIYEIRALLETHAMALAVPQLSDDRIAELERLLERMKQESDPLQRVELREVFYRSIYEAARRPRLVRLIMQLRADVGRYLLSKQIPLSHESHEELLGLCRNRDGRNAARYIERHLKQVAAMLERVVEPEGDHAPGGKPAEEGN